MQFEEFNGVQVCESAKEVIYDAEQHNMILFFSERSYYSWWRWQSFQ
jgi:hypothetical protein